MAKQAFVYGVIHLLGVSPPYPPAPVTVHMKELTVTGKSEADKLELHL